MMMCINIVVWLFLQYVTIFIIAKFTLQFVCGEMKMANEYENKILNMYICGGDRLKLYGSQNGNCIEPVRKASILELEY